MISHYSANALAFLSIATSVYSLTHTGQTCPNGYERTVDWKDCPTESLPDLKCGTLTVPLDYSDPYNNDRYLRIPMVKIPANNPVDGKRKALFTNPGGPAISGVNDVAGGDYTIRDLAGGEYDVIGFDNRGIALSNPFTNANGNTDYYCPAVNTPSPFETDSQINDAVTAFQANGDGCNASPYDTWGKLVGTAYVARDIVAMAGALSDDKLVRYIGYSWGTLLGVTTAAMFPELSDRVVVDGNISPIDYYYGDGSETPASADTAVRVFFELCASSKTKNCALTDGTESADQLLAKWDSYLSTLYSLTNDNMQQWYAAKVAMNQNIFEGAASFVSYAKSLAKSWRAQDITVTGAPLSKRDQITADQINAASAATAEKAQETANALNAVNCGDYINPNNYKADLATFKSTRDSWKAKSKYMYDAYISNQYSCYAWSVKANEQFQYPNSGISPTNPVLIVNGLYDPVTPLLSAQNSANTFANQKAGVLVSNGTGHCSTRDKSTILNTKITSYFQTGNLPDTSQVYERDVQNVFDAPASTKVKRDTFVFPEPLKRVPLGISRLSKRQNSIPVGCQPISATSSTTTSTSTTTVASTSTSSEATTTSSVSASTTTSVGVSTTPTSTSGQTTSSSETISTSTSTTSSTATTSTSSQSTSSSGSTSTTTGTTSSTSTTSTSTGTSSTSGTTSTSSHSTNSAGPISSTTILSTSTTTSGSSSLTSTSPTSTTLTTSLSASTRSTSSSLSSVSTSSTTPTRSSTSSWSWISPLWSTTSTSGTIGTSTSSSTGKGPHRSSTASSRSSWTNSGPDWSTWTTTSTSSPVTSDGWQTWSTTTTTSSSPSDPTWGSWPAESDGKTVTTYSTVVSTISKCSSTITGCKDVVTTKTIPYTTVYPTITIYSTEFINICPTGLTTDTVTITAACEGICAAKPTGIPSGYVVTKVWCSACDQPQFVDVTTSLNQYKGTTDTVKATASASASASATWSIWNDGNGNSVSSKTTPAAQSSSAATWSTSKSDGASSSKTRAAGSQAAAATWSGWNANGGADGSQSAKTSSASSASASTSASGTWGAWNANSPDASSQSTIKTTSSAATASASGTWSAWNGNGVDAASQSTSTTTTTTSSATTWSAWPSNNADASATPSGLIKPYTGAAPALNFRAATVVVGCVAGFVGMLLL